MECNPTCTINQLRRRAIEAGIMSDDAEIITDPDQCPSFGDAAQQLATRGGACGVSMDIQQVIAFTGEVEAKMGKMGCNQTSCILRNLEDVYNEEYRNQIEEQLPPRTD
ncbi:hypothetical protein GF389_02235 [Candidatus Dojkabacteria bacterium]|nr:hypothetical protein [Candidatus Dojkabacteria bacterium]